jgi:hypothetical protein
MGIGATINLYLRRSVDCREFLFSSPFAEAFVVPTLSQKTRKDGAPSFILCPERVGHPPAQVVSPENLVLNDPFILLMDDDLDIGDRALGEPHPHAGFETVTLVLNGAIYDRDEGGAINAGEVQWMTAGRGIIHSEN